ncbi:MAG: pirin family protein [Candidatus Thiodiazotropha sp. (ex Myrtea sp. 'scaly one' KF741663)]|nr:pirin family protein [Candidatus Thiodiazotropha sp. (ex Myrtea sp. 'scaly one' KF741663)]
MNSEVKTLRTVKRLVRGQETADGDGVRLTRVIGTHQLLQLDPFLLLDDFRSDNPDDYIGGFPPHPHRGFETVTYLLAGQVEHRDNAGHAGVLKAGGVQWMTAGRGVVHSEMPMQENGLLAGFQLWVNLPAAQKMIKPHYQEFDQASIPQEVRDDDVVVRVIAGETSLGTRGPVVDLATPVTYLDITLPAGRSFSESLPDGYNTFVYLIEGEVTIDDGTLTAQSLAELGEGEAVEITAASSSRLLLVAGEPLNEPIARRGPFVMNNEAELTQAFEDYQAGRF